MVGRSKVQTLLFQKPASGVFTLVMKMEIEEMSPTYVEWGKNIKVKQL